MFNNDRTINQLYAYLSTDEDGNEGVVGFQMGSMMLPMVCADWDRAQSLKEIAEAIAKNTGQTICLVKFENRSQVETIKTKE